jgi:hypothetical protein
MFNGFVWVAEGVHQLNITDFISINFIGGQAGAGNRIPSKKKEPFGSFSQFRSAEFSR